MALPALLPPSWPAEAGRPSLLPRRNAPYHLVNGGPSVVWSLPGFRHWTRLEPVAATRTSSGACATFLDLEELAHVQLPGRRSGPVRDSTVNETANSLISRTLANRRPSRPLAQMCRKFIHIGRAKPKNTDGYNAHRLDIRRPYNKI